MKDLIIYYSRDGENFTVDGLKNLEVGNTKIIAQMIKEITNADIFEIIPENPYPEKYSDCVKLAKEELSDKFMPTLKHKLTDISSYETIYVGYPNWWGTFPMVVASQLDELDFKGKKVKPFCTHEGSELGTSIRDLQTFCVGAKIEDGLAIQGSYVNSAREIVEEWIKE